MRRARLRQRATRDSPYGRAGEDRRTVIELDPPEGAIADRMRILSRLVSGAAVLRAEAIYARSVGGPSDWGPVRPALTRLEPDLP